MQRRSIKLLKNQQKKIICLTAYTSSIAKILDKYVDIILIGDSVGTAIYGMKNTQSVTIEMMMNHAKSVYDSTSRAFTIVDMPYQTYRNKKEALINARKLIKYTKCQSVKLETNEDTIKIVKHLVKNNITVVSHIGVTPQKYKNFNKIRSLGNNTKEKNALINLAINLEKAGSSIIFLECIKEVLASDINNKLKIPTIGIGASRTCDGQVLVINDILNLDNSLKKPKFIKSYTNLEKIISDAVKKYSLEVVNKKFPKKNNMY